MSVDAAIIITNEVDDIDKANDWCDEVKELLKDKVPGTFRSQFTNCNPEEELTEEPESE